MILQTHDVAAAFDKLVRAARVRGHGVAPLTVAAIAYVAQLAIDVGNYDVETIRQIEADLIERARCA